MAFIARHLEDEAATDALGAELALWLRRGDFVALKGGLGAGKSTLARAIIRALAGDPALEVPSPTFTLVQSYEDLRLPIAHVDLYRLSGAGDFAELGIDEALESGAALIEWPERMGPDLPADRLTIRLDITEDGGRDVRIEGHGGWGARLARLDQVGEFIRRAGWSDADRHFLKGDASTRSYERLRRVPPDPAAPADAVLMNDTRTPEAAIRGGRTYRQLALLAETVTPFVAVGAYLQSLGLSAPDLYFADEEAGLLLLEYLGDRDYGGMIRAGADMDAPYAAATSALARLHAAPAPRSLPLPGDRHYRVPRYSPEVCHIEVELLTDWTWPALRGSPCPADTVAEFRRIWAELFAELKGTSADTLVLRDFHSPNLLWLPDRAGAARTGIIDHQDAVIAHAAYDVVSLAQDARVDISEAREAMIVAAYLDAMPERLGLDPEGFARGYALFGAQRATRLIGLFTRLPHRDGKPEYLKHMPRVVDYLARNLRHEALRPYRVWLENHFGTGMSSEFCCIGPVP